VYLCSEGPKNPRPYPVDTRSNLADGFVRSASAFPNRTALEVGEECFSFAQLHHRARSLGATLERNSPADGPPLTAIFAYRSITAFSGVLGALLRGHGYVPLNRTFPPERSRSMLARSDCRSMIVDAKSEPQLGVVLEDAAHPLLVLLPDSEDVSRIAASFPQHRFLGARDLADPEGWKPALAAKDSIAYLLFTSGSTGTPKGVMVTHRNARAYVEFATKRYAVTPEDRFSQTFDMTFDLSVADMFVAWEAGACVCCPSEQTLLNPGQFIHGSRLSVSFLVPSTAVFMKRLGSLKKGAYPMLRLSLFCGEALPVDVARSWSEAAPNAAVENIYGPTELTIACTYYRWDPVRSPSEALHGTVPIGEPFPGMEAVVIDESGREVPPGEDGELLMTGPQLTPGYWRDPTLTASAYVALPGRQGTYYKTGDRVRRLGGDGPLLFLGRLDNQIKIRGYRIELGEIEFAVREESGTDAVVALGWPKTVGGAAGIEVFLEGQGGPPADLKERVGRRLPGYMAPRRYHVLPRLPLNPNGKYDRGKLLLHLEGLK
jgi:amino acid adenylation domain-containing protein